MFGLCIPCKNTFNRYDETLNVVASILPNFNLETIAQQSDIWKQRVAHELKSLGRIKLLSLEEVISELVMEV